MLGCYLDLPVKSAVNHSGFMDSTCLFLKQKFIFLTVLPYLSSASGCIRHIYNSFKLSNLMKIVCRIFQDMLIDIVNGDLNVQQKKF